jgi:glutaredoxin/glutathione-dependent peroxiredoxin
MALKIGDRLPDATFRTPSPDGPKTLTTADVFAGKKVVLFAVPAAFSPTCSQVHLPGYVKHHDTIKASGVDTIACLSANDAWVLDAWARQHGAEGKVLMLSDGNLEFTRAVGMELDATVVGEGLRSQRYAATVEDGIVTDLRVEEKPWLAELSSAESLCGAG